MGRIEAGSLGYTLAALAFREKEAPGDRTAMALFHDGSRLTVSRHNLTG